MAESLKPHSTGTLLGGEFEPDLNPIVKEYLNVYDITQHHNLYAHISHRNPRSGLRSLQHINNVVYDWAPRVGSTQHETKTDLINNYWKAGPESGTTSGIGVLWHESHNNKETIFFPDFSVIGSCDLDLK